VRLPIFIPASATIAQSSIHRGNSFMRRAVGGACYQLERPVGPDERTVGLDTTSAHSALPAGRFPSPCQGEAASERSTPCRGSTGGERWKSLWESTGCHSVEGRRPGGRVTVREQPKRIEGVVIESCRYVEGLVRVNRVQVPPPTLQRGLRRASDLSRWRHLSHGYLVGAVRRPRRRPSHLAESRGELVVVEAGLRAHLEVLVAGPVPAATICPVTAFARSDTRNSAVPATSAAGGRRCSRETNTSGGS
jgi:hypothetical protein